MVELKRTSQEPLRALLLRPVEDVQGCPLLDDPGAVDDDDPIVDAFKDKVSYIVAVLVGVFVILAK